VTGGHVGPGVWRGLHWSLGRRLCPSPGIFFEFVMHFYLEKLLVARKGELTNPLRAEAEYVKLGS